MPRPSKKQAAARNSWDKAVVSIKAGTKRALEILTPRKKKRKIDIGDDNDAESVHAGPSNNESVQSLSSPPGSCRDEDFFQSPGPRLPHTLGDLPADARSQFGIFSSNTR
ncbi:hypothetical protein B0H11DRAFT_1941573, partial [Mycena galericulata]